MSERYGFVIDRDCVLWATLPSLKSDLERWGQSGFGNISEDEDDVSIRCVKCARAICFDVNFTDFLLSQYECPLILKAGSFFSEGCGKRWTVGDVNKMTPAEVASLFWTAVKVPEDTIWMLEEQTDGVSRFKVSREMTSSEKVAYYGKALDANRRKKK